MNKRDECVICIYEKAVYGVAIVTGVRYAYIPIFDLNLRVYNPYNYGELFTIEPSLEWGRNFRTKLMTCTDYDYMAFKKFILHAN